MRQVKTHVISYSIVTAILTVTISFIFCFIVDRLTNSNIVLSPTTWECTKIDGDYVDLAILGKSRIVINENSCIVYTRKAK